MSAAAIIESAVRNGKTEVQVCRFPNQLCTDRGRAINQQEPGWETTLTGLPKELHLWQQPEARGHAQGPDRRFPTAAWGHRHMLSWHCRTDRNPQRHMDMLDPKASLNSEGKLKRRSTKRSCASFRSNFAISSNG
jgi:hypothetical protein